MTFSTRDCLHTDAELDDCYDEFFTTVSLMVESLV